MPVASIRQRSQIRDSINFSSNISDKKGAWYRLKRDTLALSQCVMVSSPGWGAGQELPEPV